MQATLLLNSIESMEGINERVKELRKRLNLSQTRFAEKAGISQTTVSFIENQVNDSVEIASLLKISEGTGANFEWLLKGTGQMFISEVKEGIYSNASIDDEKNGKVLLPLIPITFFGSFVENVDGQFKLNHLQFEQVTIERRKGFKYGKLDVGVTVEGSSMEHTIKSGSKLFATWVSDDRWQYLSGVCALSLKTGHVVCKRVTGDGTGILILKSDNTSYGDMTVQVADVAGAWKIAYAFYVPID